MCEQCFSRRGFLKAGLIAGVGAVLAACGDDAAIIVPAPSAEPTLPQTPSVDPDLPYFGGQITSLDGASIGIADPLARRSFSLVPGAALLDADGNQVVFDASLVGSDVLLWVEPQDTASVTRVQLTPFQTTLEPLPNISQPEPTGETTTFGPLTMITRAGWGAGDPVRIEGDDGETGLYNPEDNPAGWLEYDVPLSFTTAIIHHSALSYEDGPRRIQQYHIVKNEYADIAYHFLVDGLGTLYEGRDIGVRGAHTGGANTGTLGICLLGNFSVLDGPTQAQLNTVRVLVPYLSRTYGITHFAGHSTFQPGVTECPGLNFIDRVDDLAGEMGLQFGTGGYVPPA